jgi:hypothetical protein
MKKEARSFLKKRTKKLLIVGLGAVPGAESKSQKFFVSFFQKRNVFF